MDKRAAADLARSGISVTDAEAAGMFYAKDARELYPEFKPLPALVIPYFDVNGEPVLFDKDKPFCRVRYLEAASPASFIKQKPQRYGQPQASGTRAYFPNVEGLSWAKAQGDESPLIITEGEKKALATTLAGFTTIGLGGVYNWLHGGALLPELQAFQWKGREVYIAFDSDAALNPNIQAAEARLVEELMRGRGAL